MSALERNLGRSSINCFCYICGKYENTTDKIHITRSTDTYKLFYITGGHCRIFVDKAEFNILKHESFLVFPNSKVVIVPSKSDPLSFCWVEFGGLTAKSMLARTSFTKTYPFVGKIKVKNFSKLFEITDSGLVPSYARYRAGAKVLILLSYYMEHFPQHSSRNNAYVVSATNYIEQNLSNSKLCVYDVANHVKLDRTYLYKLFKDEIGLSIIEYINKSRISRAEVLLANKRTSVKDIAISVGFTDPLYFSRVFKKHNGMTPTEYRRSTQEWE